MQETRRVSEQPHRHTAVLEAMKRRVLADRASRDGEPSRTPKPYVYMSGWQPCERRMVHDVLDHWQRPAFDVEVLARFARGDNREDAVRIWLERAGQLCEPRFLVQGVQAEATFASRHRNRTVLKGRVDLLLRFDDGAEIAAEIKSWAQHTVDRIETFSDLLRSPWTRGAAYQLAGYVWGRGLPEGWLVLDQLYGMPKIITVTHNECIEHAERFWSRSEHVMTIADGLAEASEETADTYLRDSMTPEPGDCARCWCNGVVCFPPDEVGADGGRAIETDEETIQAVARMMELYDPAHEYESIKRQVDKRFRGRNLIVCGDWIGRGKIGQRTAYEVPDAVKAQYKTMTETYALKWEKARK